MKANWKLIGIGAGAVAGVLMIAAVLFVVFFPKELAAREAERRIEEATGRELTLGPNIEISLFPNLGFSVDNASLSNPEGFDEAARRGGADETPFIAADRIVFAVALMPLLGGDIEVKRLIFDGAEVRLQAKEDGTANWTFPTEEDSEQPTLEDLRLDDVQLNDSLITFDGADDGAPLTLEDVDARLALSSLDEPATLNAAFNYLEERVNIDGTVGSPRAIMEKRETTLDAQVRSEPLNASFDGTFDAETGLLAGALESRGVSLRRLLAWIGSPMAEGGGFGAFEVAGQLRREGDTIALTEATLGLDHIQASGNLSIVTQENERLRIDGALTAPRIDLNTYLPAPAQGADAGGVAVNQGWSNDPIDFTGLRALDANLSLNVGALRFQRMDFSDVQMALRLANGAADARLTRISLYGGSGTGRLIADGSGAAPRLAVELNAENVQAEPLLRDAIGFDKITGRGALRASLVGRGPSQAAIMRSLGGNAAFTFNDGQWKGVNLAQMARSLQSVVSGQAVSSGGGATDFAELAANFTVANGVAATENLRLLNPFVRLEGAGLVNIGAQTIDMRIAPRAVRSSEGQGGDATIAGLGIPFRVTGPWSRVSFRPAVEEIVQNQLRDILSRREGGENPLGALGEALFGRAPAPAPETPAETPGPDADAETPAPAPEQPKQQERPRNPLEDIFRRAMEGEQKQAPAPSP
ncbi:MAG TPA: AsmA family protein [Candidatus Binatia bacterium]|nr:AsmA family protein [Candidatus Binatia bacterium]